VCVKNPLRHRGGFRRRCCCWWPGSMRSIAPRAACESRDPAMPWLVWLAMRVFHVEAVKARPRLWPWISVSEDEGGVAGSVV
jgi:hypothetical protein